jgi:hypothetical protein
VCPSLGSVMLPVPVNAPAAGSYSSALRRESPLAPRPPTMSTFPFGNRVAVCPDLGSLILPVAVNVPELGSNSSAPANSTTVDSHPPAMSTFPLANSVAVWLYLATAILPVGAKPPCAGAVPPTAASVVPPPPDPDAGCSSIAVREQASPANDTATAITNHRCGRPMPARLSAKHSQGSRPLANAVGCEPGGPCYLSGIRDLLRDNHADCFPRWRGKPILLHRHLSILTSVDV